MIPEKNTNHLLQIRNIVREYRLPRQQLFGTTQPFRALDGVSLMVNPGESFGIVGESGCGKSTLARTVMALEAPQSGEIIFQGQNLHSVSTEELRRMRHGLQMIFQDPYGSLDPRHSVEQIVAEPLSLLGKITIEKRQELVSTALDNVGLSPADANKFPHQFSGGQRQRIAIARALITKPALIVADEPVSALDVSVQAQVLNLMLDLREQHGLAYLFISHDLSIVKHMTTKVAVMYTGKVVETAPTIDLFNHAQHPYTRALMAAVPRPDPFLERSDRSRTSRSQQLDISPDSTSGSGCSYASRCPFAEDICRNENPVLQNLQTNSAMAASKETEQFVHQVACFRPLDFVSSS
ncbi:MAG: ABC transporter ATP-binding protein [SAR324 cluster bacterium]|nr:ABC transporter ATP-binding protein [SAR324 cluster bacterium]MBL7034480.1 ABC transporter ATP-binding protein [SAR324 cluster bacterium]